MIRRPKATDTEDDLLAFQERFLESKENPSATLQHGEGGSSSSSSLRAGKKRSQQGSSVTVPQERDVVQLQAEGCPPQESSKPPLKKSKFKEEREKMKMRKAPEDPHEAMERQDRHITKVLANIQEHEMLALPTVTVPTRVTRQGFPSVHSLESDVISKRSINISSDEKTKRDGTPKSLFAQQFEAHGLEYFGIEAGETPQPQQLAAATVQRDLVDPIQLGEGGGEIKEGRQPSEKVAEHGNLGQDTLRGEYDSRAAQTYDKFIKSTLISGEGLKTAGGVPGETAVDVVSKIHQENVELLSSLPEEEILREKERVEQVLGPKLVSFLQSKKKKGSDHKPKEEGVEMADNERQAVSHPSSSLPSHSLAPPEGWVHMDVIEKNKMEWMTDITQDKQGEGEGGGQHKPMEVRFSFNGLVVPHEVDVPTHLGLHHHGDEPQAAGYTLYELLPLCRSTVLQQRVLSLQTLAKIIQRARQGEYTNIVEGSVLGNLLSDGVCLLLRVALDESSNAVMFAAINAIHSLLVVPIEEYLLEEYSYFHHGFILPALKSHDDRPAKECEDEKETDDEIFQKDVVKGFLHVKLHHRIRYILEVCCLPATTLTQLLEVLTRIARHSTQAASQVVNCPRLMSVVFKEFLPLSWEEEREENEDQKAHGRPQVSALRLVMALCSAGRQITAHLVSTYKLLSVLSRYTVLHPSDLSLPKKKAYNLVSVSMKTWAVALQYGLGGLTFRDTYPVFLQWLQKLSAVNILEVDHLETKRVAALLRLVQAALHVAAITPDQLKTGRENVKLQPPALEWNCATGMLEPVTVCLVQWVEQTVSKETQVDKMVCIAGLLQYVSAYYSKLLTQKPGDITMDVLQTVEALVSGVVDKLLHSSLLSCALESLRTTSSFVSTPDRSSCTPSHLSLLTHLTLPPSPKQARYGLQTMQYDDFLELVHSQLTCFTACDLILGYLSLCFTLAQLHKGVTDKVTEICVNATFCKYLERVIEAPTSKQMCFGFGELYVLYTAVKLFMIKFDSPGPSNEQLVHLYHLMSFKLLTLLPPGMEHLASELLTTVALHPALLRLSTSQSVMDIASMTLSEHDGSVSVLLSRAVETLPSVTNMYLKAFEKAAIWSRHKVEKSKALFECHPLQTESLLSSPYHFSLLPVDWVLFPIIQEYNRSVALKSAESPEVSSETTVMVTHTLHLLLLLEHCCPRVLRELPISAKLARLMCVFLIGSDLFLDDAIRSLLMVLLKLYCSGEAQTALNFDSPVPGLVSFVELYSSLLDQFAAVSYGDRVFASFVLLPLQQRFNVSYRRMVWSEHSSIVRIMSLPLSQVPVDVNCFLYPVETDASLLEMYMSALALNEIRQDWSPLFYLIAVHHLHSYLFVWSDSTAPPTHNHLTGLQRKLLQGVLQLKDEELKQQLLFYDGPTESGLKLKSSLTETQKSRLLSVAENNHLNPLVSRYL